MPAPTNLQINIRTFQRNSGENVRRKRVIDSDVTDIFDLIMQAILTAVDANGVALATLQDAVDAVVVTQGEHTATLAAIKAKTDTIA